MKLISIDVILLESQIKVLSKTLDSSVMLPKTKEVTEGLLNLLRDLADNLTIKDSITIIRSTPL